MLINKPRFPIKEIIFFGFLPSFLKIFVYRLRGARIGNRVSIGFGSVLVGEEIEVGEGTSIGFLTVIRGKQIRIGRYVKIGSTSIIDTERIEIDDDAKINEQVFIGGPSLPDSYIKIGKRTIIMQLSFLNPTRPLIIGDDTGIGGHCLLFTHGSWQSKLDGYPVSFAPITLGKNVWLPWRVFIMPGVTIGDGATIGANSLVNKDIPPGCLAAGSPAKVLKTAEEYPAKLSITEKERIMQEILSEFFSFVKYHKLFVSIKQTVPYLRADISKQRKIYFFKKQTYALFYFGSEARNLIPKELNSNSLYICLNTIPQDMKTEITNCGAMWIDLETRERSGSNPLGEEVVLFLGRYGLRFKRID